MNKKNFFLQCVLCAAFTIGVMPTFALTADDKNINIDNENKPIYQLNDSSDDFVFNIFDSEFYSTSGKTYEGSGLVGNIKYIVDVTIDNSTFKNIVSNKEGSVLHLSQFTNLINLNNSIFERNGIIANSTEGGNLEIYGGALSMPKFEPHPETPESGYVPNDIFEMTNTTFSGNYINTSVTGTDASINVAGGAVGTHNIAYTVGSDGNTNFVISDFDTTITDWQDAEGGIKNSIFTNNKINASTNSSNNSNIYAYGGALSANYIREIDDSQFTKNSISTNILTSGSAIGTISGAAVYAGGVSEIKNSNFDENVVNQTLNGDFALSTIGGGVVGLPSYDTELLSKSTFNNNSISTKANGSSMSEIQINGGILSNNGIMKNITNTSFSGNNVNAHATGNLESGNIYTQGGQLYAYQIENFENNTISNNNLELTSIQSINLLGGDVHSTSSLTSISNSRLSNNTKTLTTNGLNSYVNVEGGSLYANQTYNEYAPAYDDGTTIMPEVDPENQEEQPAMTADAFMLAEEQLTFIEKGIDEISDSEFKGNKLTINSNGLDNFTNVDGGVIRSTLIINDTTNSTFEDNSTTINISGQSSNAILNGGVISTPTAYNITNTSFKNNSAIVNSNLNGSIIDAKGGALSVQNRLDKIENSSFSGNKIEINSTDSPQNSISAKGGALYIDSTPTSKISNSNFSNNKITITDTNAKAQGGAVYINSAENIEFADTIFKNNSAKEGGAIYSNSNVTIKAQDADVLFEGNTAENGGDIFINDSILELYTNTTDRIISLDGGIALGSTSTAIPELRTTGEGTVILNAPITYVGESTGLINLTGNTTLKVLNDSNISNEKIGLTLNGNSVLDIMNGQGNKIALNDLNVLSDSNSIKMDINLDGSQSDYFSLSSTNPSSTGVLNITNINLLSDSDEKTKLVQVSSGGHNVNTNQIIYTNKNKYIVTGDTTETDKLNFTKENDTDIDGFAEAVADQNAGSFSALDNIVTDLSIKGNTVGRNFYVFGNNKSIDFSGKDNLAVSNGATLTLDNISELKNSGENALTVGDNSKVEIKSTSTNTNVNTQVNLNSNSSIVNVTLAGGNSILFSNKVSGNKDSKGTINITSGTADFNEIDSVALGINNGELNLNKGISNSDLKAFGSAINIFDNAEQVNLIAENSSLNINSPVAQSALNAKNSVINLADQTYLNSSALTMNNSNMALANNVIGSMELSSLTLEGKNDITVDVDMSNLTADKINADEVTIEDGATLNVSSFNITKNSFGEGGKISITDNKELKQSTTTSVTQVDNGLYSYAVNKADDGDFNFKVTRFDPAVITAPAAQQAMLTTMLNTYDYSFSNMDMIMLKPYSQRMAMRHRNKVAISDLGQRGYLDHMRNYHRTDYDNGPWLKPYGSIENIRFNDGPKVKNYTYGSVIGFDSSLIHKKSYDAVISGHIAYNGSIQDYESVRVNQNGASAGLTAALYKRNFFTGLTLAGGVSLADAKTSHGKEDFTLYSAGVASKTGFNFETEGGYFVFQPSLLASYTYANTNDYTNASGLRITSDAFNSVQLEPGVKFIFNFDDSLQSYLGVSGVFTIMGESKFETSDISLPRISLDPYGQYKLGIQKRWGERSLGYAQTTLRSGGRTGAELQLGLRLAI